MRKTNFFYDSDLHTEAVGVASSASLNKENKIFKEISTTEKIQSVQRPNPR